MGKEVAAFTVSEDDDTEFLTLVEARSNMPDTHAQFAANLDRKIRQIEAQGMTVGKVVVPIKTFRELISTGQIKADSNGRAKAAAMIAMCRLDH